MDLHDSAAGRRMIEGFEGCVLHAYPDPATGGDPWTIGYGCTGRGIGPGLVITQAEADQMLSDRLAREFEPGVATAIGAAAATQAQFDAMVSLAYNIGVGAFGHSNVAHDHRLGRYAAAAQAFLAWDRAAGRALPALLRRRRAEAALYLSQSAEAAAIPPSALEAQPTALVHIAALQAALNAAGMDPAVAVDGIYGAETRDAIRAYQVDAKLPATGLPDAATLAALGVPA